VALTVAPILGENRRPRPGSGIATLPGRLALPEGPDDVLPCRAGEPEVYNGTKLSAVTLGDDADLGRGQFAPPGGSPDCLPAFQRPRDLRPMAHQSGCAEPTLRYLPYCRRTAVGPVRGNQRRPRPSVLPPSRPAASNRRGVDDPRTSRQRPHSLCRLRGRAGRQQLLPGRAPQRLPHPLQGLREGQAQRAHRPGRRLCAPTAAAPTG
jgi:hypothetical protein